MAINSNVLLQGIVPDAVGAARQGFNLGRDFKRAPLIDASDQLKIEQGQQSVQEGEMDLGTKFASTVASIAGESPINENNYLQTVSAMQRLGIPVEQTDLQYTPENAQALEKIRQAGLRTAQASGRGGLASAKTTQYKDGTAVLILPNGTRRVIDPQGQVVQDPERQQAVIDAANESGIIQAGQEAFVTSSETQRGKGTEGRAQSLIDRGITAAESTATLRRAIDLLDSVETGGIDSVSLRAKQIFGVEGADEGELSNALGKAVLSQLRETFGAAFTEEEGKRLERIEAGFGKSPATNRRLLEQSLRIAERTANRAKSAAKERGDDATVQDIDDLLSFSLSEPEQQTQAGNTQGMSAAERLEAARRNAGVR